MYPAFSICKIAFFKKINSYGWRANDGGAGETS